jgi:hypothetical protein
MTFFDSSRMVRKRSSSLFSQEESSVPATVAEENPKETDEPVDLSKLSLRERMAAGYDKNSWRFPS